MRVFHMLSNRHGVSALKDERLKVAQFEDLNDPFELLSARLPTPAIRQALAGFKQFMHGKLGVLCFGRDWNSPVMWSHYADKHRGMCLGFDIPDDLAITIRYVSGREALRFQNDVESEGVDTNFALNLLRSKFNGWKYEKEVRMYLDLDADTQRDHDLHFYSFGRDLKLREVVLGPRCESTVADIRRLVDHLCPNVKLTQSRLAFETFRVVTNRAAK